MELFRLCVPLRRAGTITRQIGSLTALLIAVTSTATFAQDSEGPPIILQKSGGFIVGGFHQVLNPATPNRTLSCDHGYVEYFLPVNPRKTSMVLWHSSSTQVWQNRWDGGEGYKDKLLRAGYPTYLWDGPRVGRANWSCDSITYTPQTRDQGNFTAWNFGPKIPAGQVPTLGEWWPNTQFPIHSPNYVNYWWNATGARYDEFDLGRNIEIETDAAAVAADSGQLGNQIVYLTNSAGGLRAMKTTAKSQTNNIAGMVTYESIGYVFPMGDPRSPAACTDTNGPGCAFGPLLVAPEDFKKLARLKIQFVWGDHRTQADSPSVYQYVLWSRLCADLINDYAKTYNLPGHAEVLMLGEDTPLRGNTHIAFMDENNDQVAALLAKFLNQNKLDSYQGKPRGHWSWDQ